MSYKFMACPNHEFSVQFLLPHDKRSMLKWEKVQMMTKVMITKITKMMKRL